jgi:hypothetical protein
MHIEKPATNTLIERRLLGAVCVALSAHESIENAFAVHALIAPPS